MLDAHCVSHTQTPTEKNLLGILLLRSFPFFNITTAGHTRIYGSMGAQLGCSERPVPCREPSVGGILAGYEISGSGIWISSLEKSVHKPREEEEKGTNIHIPRSPQWDDFWRYALPTTACRLLLHSPVPLLEVFLHSIQSSLDFRSSNIIPYPSRHQSH